MNRLSPRRMANAVRIIGSVNRLKQWHAINPWARRLQSQASEKQSRQIAFQMVIAGLTAINGSRAAGEPIE